jgi:hypothetical protein
MSNRNSIAGPLLASPLSTSLSTMVQDLKRGANVRDVRRRESVLGIGRRGEEDERDMLGEPMSRRQTRDSQQDGGEPVGRMGGRGRSLSGTLGELWRGLRGQSSREDFGEEGRER